MHIRSLSDLTESTGHHPDYQLYTNMPASHSCLLSGSLIDTPAGLQAIDFLRPGDHVWGFAHDHKLAARIFKVYRAESAPSGMRGYRLGERAILSANSSLYWHEHWAQAASLPLEPVSFEGPVYDLLTDTHNFYCQGVLMACFNTAQQSEQTFGGLR